MSKQDTHFFNTFSVVLGLLVAFAIAMFALARYVGASTQQVQVVQDPMFVAAVEARTRPPVRVAVAGEDNSALKIVAPVSAAPVAALPKDGPGAFETACKTCHGPGLAGAPKVGDKAAWAARIAQGKATLHEHALKGFQGKTGIMPAKGGRADFSDELVESAVDYMISL